MQIIRKIRHPSRDFTVPIVVAKIPIVVAIPGSDGGDCFHGSKKHSSLPPAAAHLLKGCNISLYHCFFLPYDGNGSIYPARTRSREPICFSNGPIICLLFFPQCPHRIQPLTSNCTEIPSIVHVCGQMYLCST